MSDCQNHDCQKLVEVLQLIIDNEASTEEKEFFEKHVQECAPCLDHYEIDKKLQSILKEILHKKTCPQNIISSIKLELQKIS